MSVNENPPAVWAMSEACRRVGVSFNDYRSGAFTSKFHLSLREMARLIEQHEEAPVDPLLDVAQALADDHRLNLSAMPKVEEALLEALRRGIELGRAST